MVTIYNVDFGLCQFYIVNKTHIKPSEDGSGCASGTIEYLAVYGHTHKKLSRGSDLESLAYMLIKCEQGDLKWEGNKHDEAGLKKIYHLKSTLEIKVKTLSIVLVFFAFYLLIFSENRR